MLPEGASPTTAGLPLLSLGPSEAEQPMSPVVHRYCVVYCNFAKQLVFFLLQCYIVYEIPIISPPHPVPAAVLGVTVPVCLKAGGECPVGV